MKLLRIFSVIVSVLLLAACQNNDVDAQYLITKDKIGKLTKHTPVYQLDSIFAKDSIVTLENSGPFSSGSEIIIYSPDGKEMLRLQPVKSFDSTSTIASVEVIDTMYSTKAGLHKGASFKVLKTNYNISRIENVLGAAMVFVEGMNIYVTIDKKDILEPNEMGVDIKASQIKDKAKIKHFWVFWQ